MAEFPEVEAYTDIVLNISFINSVYRFACAPGQFGVAIVTGLKWAYHVLTMVMLSERTHTPLLHCFTFSIFISKASLPSL